MIESLILIEGQNLSEETLGSVSLSNAKQLMIGSTPGGAVMLHVAANSADDLGTALLAFAQVAGVTKVFTLALQIAGNNMIESLILIEGQNLSEETLGSVSLSNAKQLVIGSIPGGAVMLHVAANAPADLGAALLAFAQVSGVTQVLPLTLQNPG